MTKLKIIVGRYLVVLLAATWLDAGGNAFGANFNFTKVADTNTPVPGGSGNFDGLLGHPSLEGGNVAFVNEIGPAEGVYTKFGSTLAKVANLHTAVPSGSGSFGGFNSVSISGTAVSFRAFGFPGPVGIYTDVSGSLVRVADTSTPIPSGVGNFPNLGSSSISGNTIAFDGEDLLGAGIGIYASIDGVLAKVVDTNSPQPGGSGNFDYFVAPTLDANNLAFWARNAAVFQGIYRSIGGGAPTVVADNSTVVPGAGGTFSIIRPFPAINGTNVSFKSYGSNGSEGVYRFNGALSTVADTTTPVPGGPGLFVGFDDYSSIGGDDVAFLGYFTARGSATEGIYTTLGGGLSKVIKTGDALDGRLVNGVYMGPEAMDGESIVISVSFDDGSTGIYLANLTTVPEPHSLVLAVAGLLPLACGHRIRRDHFSKR